MQRGEVAPVTPGEILREEFLAEYDLSQGALARAFAAVPRLFGTWIWYHKRGQNTADVDPFGRSPA